MLLLARCTVLFEATNTTSTASTIAGACVCLRCRPSFVCLFFVDEEVKNRHCRRCLAFVPSSSSSSLFSSLLFAVVLPVPVRREVKGKEKDIPVLLNFSYLQSVRLGC